MFDTKHRCDLNNTDRSAIGVIWQWCHGNNAAFAWPYTKS